MNCFAGYDDCRYEGDKYALCFNGFHYEAKSQRKNYVLRKHANKAPDAGHIMYLMLCVDKAPNNWEI